jgi:hypothetical protein
VLESNNWGWELLLIALIEKGEYRGFKHLLG